MLTDVTVLVGAGGHAKVVIDACLAQDANASIVLVSEVPAELGTFLLGYAVEDIDGLSWQDIPFHVCVGSNSLRRRIAATLAAKGGIGRSIRHPTAVVSPFAQIHSGSFLAARAIVGPESEVGRFVIVNHGSIVDHDVHLGDCCHVAPGATLGGGVRVGNDVLVGAGANILPGVRIGDRAVIGAGAVVTKDVPEDTVVAGIPARRLK